MTDITPPSELVNLWVDLLEARSDQAVFTLAAQWGYEQAVEELATVLKEIVDTPCNNSMTNQHPITPPPELVVEWADTIYQQTENDDQRDLYVATRAARWGADMELEACCEWLRDEMRAPIEWSNGLRAARRPKPPSLKEQAKKLLDTHNGTCGVQLTVDQCDTIRQALKE